MKFPTLPMKGKPVEQTVTDIINYLRACRITGMVGGRVQETPNGTTLHVIPGKASTGSTTIQSTGAFYTMSTVVSGDATNGDIMLAGGQVSAGTGNPVVSPILIFDQSASGGSGAWTGTVGQVLQLAITGDGSEVDDVLMPTFDADATLSVPAASTGLTANVLPTVSSLAGTCYVSLGVFGAAGFIPANVGNIGVSFCYGGFTVSRF